MNKFKVGDRVKVVRLKFGTGSNGAKLNLGKTSTVIEVDGQVGYVVTDSCGPDKMGIWFEEIELVKGCYLSNQGTECWI